MKMTADRNTYRAGRRGFLKFAAAAGAAGLASGPVSLARAQAQAGLSFQLSWIRSIQYGGYFAGLENGFFKDEGLNAEFISGGPGIDTVANVVAGRSVMGDRPSAALVIARDRGLPVKIIGSAFQKSPGALMSPADKPIRSIKELAGKTVALPNTARPLVTQMIREAGVDPNSVRIVPVGTDPGLLASGQVDAYYGYSTNQGLMLKMRGFNIHVLNMTDAGAPNLVGVIYAREDFLKTSGDLAVRWLRASMRSWDWAMNNPEKTADLMVGKYGAPGLDRAQQLAELKESTPFMRPPGGKGPLFGFDPAILQKEIEQMRAVGLVKSAMTAAELCDTQYIVAAQRKA